ncbi:MAG: phosphate acyltransferase PlsX [Bacteroidota bacterium]
MRIRIAVDAMGGDYAPHNVIVGALDALHDTGNRFELILVGNEQRIRQEIHQIRQNDLAYTVVDAPETIEMAETPTSALKAKRKSSIAVGVQLQKEGKANAFVSAGNTGAVMSASTLILGRIPGVARPTIGAFFPSEGGACLLLDAGANVDCTPRHLLQFAAMGTIYARCMLNYHNPTVGLLSIGEESTKGNEGTLRAFRLLSNSKLNFIGNIEGRDILKGKAQVVVCDGFVGNIVLKFGESLLTMLKKRLRNYATRNFLRRAWIALTYGTIKKILRDFDYQVYGGVPFLGVNGVSIVGHGGSTPKAFKNMILRAEEMVKKNIHKEIEHTIREV